MSVPPFHGNISFHAQHAPMGAFFSFTCGHFGSPGGFGLQIGKPGNQNLYIGVKDGDRTSDAPLKCLPFFEGADADEAARFDVEKKAGEKKPGITAYRREEIQRHYGWATDKWVTPDFSFTINTPFAQIPDPNQSEYQAFPDTGIPAITAELELDNTAGTSTRTIVFAIKFAETGVRLLERMKSSTHRGFAVRSHYGVAGCGTQFEQLSDGEGASLVSCSSTWATPILFNAWDVADGLRRDVPHLLGNTPGLAVEVPPGEKWSLSLVLGCYLLGPVTTRLEGRYQYTRDFANLEDVLNRASAVSVGMPSQIDDELTASNLSPDQQFLIAHATRSYYGSTQLLDVGGQPFWVVNEGEYCMMNTLDLSVDQVFWELKQNPWVVRNLLDNFVRHYSYVDQHGLSFCHDMGVHNQFSPFGHSSYELPNLNAVCFSYMTCEELCNWILIAASYVKKTGDLEWAKKNQHVVDACFISLVNRCDEHGFPAYDSSRCGDAGAEITTYDSLDHSLAQTRNNLYMVVKSWASFRALELIYDLIDEHHEYYDASIDMAERIEKELPTRAGSDGIFPAVFEKENAGYASKILPAIEGLMYPLYWGSFSDRLATPLAAGSSRSDEKDPAQAVSLNSRSTLELIDALKKHTVVLLKGGENLFPDGGIKLSSTSNNSWMSKIAIFQHVCRKVFKLDEDREIRELFARADAAHVKWMTEGDSAYWACSDQFVSGVAKGSKYYPRIITTALWMDE